MKHTQYCWNNDLEQVETTYADLSCANPVPAEGLHRYCVDSTESRTSERYGMWCAEDDDLTDPQWAPIPKEAFPKKFLAALLILGVQ